MSCAGRVVAVTGSGRGIGREHALLFAKEGAKVIVNDLGGSTDGQGTGKVADEVVAEIKAMGGQAAAHYEDCSTMDGGKSLIQCAIDNFGGIDTLVNNAGILRDKTLINMDEGEWDAIMKVHLKGAFCPTQAALQFWRKCATEGKPRKGRVVFTSSGAGLYGNYGQTNYGVAKAGLGALGIILNAEVERMGIRCNVLAPAARTRMTIPLGGPVAIEAGEGKFDEFHPRNMSPIVVWFGSDSCEIGGMVAEVIGRKITSLEGWRPGQSANKEGGPDAMWTMAELTKEMPKIYSESKRHIFYRMLDRQNEARAKRAKKKAKL